MKPEEYLQYLKESADEEWGINAPSFQTDAAILREGMIDRLPPEVRSRARDLLKQFPTLSTRSDFLVAQIRQELKELLPAEDWEQIASVPIGILNSAEFNGFAVRVPGGGHVAVLNSSLLGILHGVNKTLMKFTVADENEPELDNATLEALIDRLLDRLPDFARSVVTQNRQKPPFPIEVGYGQLTLANIYTSIQELFCFAHEYSHILLGHVEAYEKHSDVFGKSITVDVYQRSREQELAADTHAAGIILKCQHGDPNMQAIGLVILFNLLALCEKIRPGRSARTTMHPPPEKRKANIIQFYDAHLHEGGWHHIKNMNTIFKACMM